MTSLRGGGVGVGVGTGSRRGERAQTLVTGRGERAQTLHTGEGNTPSHPTPHPTLTTWRTVSRRGPSLPRTLASGGGAKGFLLSTSRVSFFFFVCVWLSLGSAFRWLWLPRVGLGCDGRGERLQLICLRNSFLHLSAVGCVLTKKTKNTSWRNEQKLLKHGEQNSRRDVGAIQLSRRRAAVCANRPCVAELFQKPVECQRSIEGNGRACCQHSFCCTTPASQTEVQ